MRSQRSILLASESRIFKHPIGKCESLLLACSLRLKNIIAVSHYENAEAVSPTQRKTKLNRVAPVQKKRTKVKTLGAYRSTIN